MTSDLTLVLRRNAVKALARGDLEEARAILARLEAEDPLGLETRGLKLELAIKSGRLDEARVLADQLLVLHPASARVRLLAGQLCCRLKDYDQAIGHLRESQRLHAHPATDRWLGKVLSYAGRHDEAEAVLRGLLAADPGVHQDLAWIEERRGRFDRALEHWEAFLVRWPDSAFAKAARERLRARVMGPVELLGELDALLAMGEKIPPHLVPEYVEGLMTTGQGERARAVVAELAPTLDTRNLVRTAWSAYRLQALDVAFDLFVRVFPDVPRDAKFLTALESAARRAHRLPDLLRLYESHAPQDRRLFGRIKTLQRRADG